jgi:ArsR family transcriptional regulator, arsenate/arsenite/antimonite-responsive transcriptional repressor / arsenate reductase (thioredoxin)
VLGDPARWDLVLELSESDRRVGELTARTGRAQNLVSYHLRELRSAGLVTSRRSSADGRDTYYRLDLQRVGAELSAAGAEIHPGLRLAPAPPAAPPARGTGLRVLFLCTGNSARSQMAEAFLEHRTHGKITARSAGSAPKPLHPLAIRAMADWGIDISTKRSKHLDRFVTQRFDRVVTLCDKVREVCPEVPGATAVHWSMPDPSVETDDGGGTYAAFTRTADEIERRVDLLITQLTSAASKERSSDG